VDILYGVHPVAECIRAGRRRVDRIWVSDESRLNELAQAAGCSRNLKVDRLSRQALNNKAGTQNHQGVAAQFSDYPYVDWQDLLTHDRPPLLLLLDNLTDPQNVGAILRSALCAGATGVTLRKHHAARITPAVVKASAGASEHLQVALVPNQAMVLREAADSGFACAALAMDGESIWEADLNWRGPLAIVVGAEGRGVSPLVASLCESKLRIPMAPGFDSLNASVAASLALFEAARRRR
jgi:23S rRNA (guanosine2251-2'-O)-methyltransferase